MPNVPLAKAILLSRCPRCRTGKIFTYPVFSFKSFTATNKKCSTCELEFEREPRFFDGAMYVSYAMNVGIFLTVGLFLNFVLGDPPLWVYIASVLGAVVLLIPFIYRYARVIYLYLAGGIKYNQDQATTSEDEKNY